MKKLAWLLCAMMLVLGLSGIASATVMIMPDNAYVTPPGWVEIDSGTGGSLTHGSDYFLPIDDIDNGPPYPYSGVDPSLDITGISFIFHGIQNWSAQDTSNTLTVSLFDGLLTATTPTTSLGTWTDPDGPRSANDVVWTTTEPTLLSYLKGGDSFGFFFEPRCHYYYDGWSVDVSQSAPAPEPATMLLLGTGLVSLGAFGRKKLKK